MEKKKKKKEKKEKKKERGEIDGQLREWIYLLQYHDLCTELGPKKKKVKGVLLQNDRSSTILSVFYPKMNNKKLK